MDTKITVTVLTVSDLHQSGPLYHALENAVIKHSPDIVACVGDVIDGIQPDNRLDIPKPFCARRLAALPVKEIIFVRGNHESEQWQNFSAGWPHARRPMHALHAEAFVQGPLVITGFPCFLGDEIPFRAGRPAVPNDPRNWFFAQAGAGKTYGEAARTLWLMHEPPRGTPLSSQVPAMEGNQEWNDAIEEFSPLLTISGHDHYAPQRTGRWHIKMGKTVCINLGQSQQGPLHFALVQMDFDSDQPTLPTEIRVTAFPYRETLTIRPE